MGCAVEATCRKCGTKFKFCDGGGFLFERVRCAECGEDKAVLYAELKKQGLSPQNHAEIESFAGKCACGGNFRVNAAPRCPKCRSSELKRLRTFGKFD